MSKTTADRDTHDDRADRARTGGSKAKNTAPDAVKDPSEKTEGKPGLPPANGQGKDADPGGG